jgi:hypothetical protein
MADDQTSFFRELTKLKLNIPRNANFALRKMQNRVFAAVRGKTVPLIILGSYKYVGIPGSAGQ